jgi:hypothetical protein
MYRTESIPKALLLAMAAVVTICHAVSPKYRKLRTGGLF